MDELENESFNQEMSRLWNPNPKFGKGKAKWTKLLSNIMQFYFYPSLRIGKNVLKNN